MEVTWGHMPSINGDSYYGYGSCNSKTGSDDMGRLFPRASLVRQPTAGDVCHGCLHRQESFLQGRGNHYSLQLYGKPLAIGRIQTNLTGIKGSSEL